MSSTEPEWEAEATEAPAESEQPEDARQPEDTERQPEEAETLEREAPGREAPEETQPPEPVVQDGAPDQLELTEPPELDRGAIEAILLVTDEPLQVSSLAEVLEQPVPRVETALRELAEEYTAQQRGFELREVAGGWRLYTREQYAAIVEKFVLDGQQAKLTQAALETLAVVAYRQPVSRARVSAIRGVNCDGVMKTLVARGLVTEIGTDHESGATLFGTTGYFLERLGLGSLDELPDLAPYLPDIDEMEELAEGIGGRSEPSGPETAEETEAAETQGTDAGPAESEPADAGPADPEPADPEASEDAELEEPAAGADPRPEHETVLDEPARDEPAPGEPASGDVAPAEGSDRSEAWL